MVCRHLIIEGYVRNLALWLAGRPVDTPTAA
jgi:hypothetical protein